MTDRRANSIIDKTEAKGEYSIMAHKAESFRLNEKKKTITIYTNVEAAAAEIKLRDFYLANGYKPFMEEKKAGITVKEMRKELEADKEAAAAFEAAYKEKNGFFNACKIYTNWKKNNKKK